MILGQKKPIFVEIHKQMSEAEKCLFLRKIHYIRNNKIYLRLKLISSLSSE